MQMSINRNKSTHKGNYQNWALDKIKLLENFKNAVAVAGARNSDNLRQEFTIQNAL
jgi:hypothetical protein